MSEITNQTDPTDPTDPTDQLTRPPVPMTLIQAISVEEGFYVSGSRPARNFNPGDLEWHPWMMEFGSTGGDPRFAIFPNAEQGFAALRHLLGFHMYVGKTISQAIGIFAPGNENNVASYVRNVAAWCEKSPDTIIDDILG